MKVRRLTPVLFVEEIEASLHETFYGMREVTVREPGGHVVTFATRCES